MAVMGGLVVLGGLLGTEFSSGRGNEKQRNLSKIALVPSCHYLKPGDRFWGEEVSSKPGDR